MKTVKLISFFSLLLFTIAFSAGAQTIDYSNLGYSQSICNVFNVNPPKKVGGLDHYPISGGVSYNGNALVLNTKGGQTISTTLGTSYAINMAIKQGYTYSVTVKAMKSSQDPVSAPTFWVSAIDSYDPNKTNPTACGAVDRNKWGSLQSDLKGFAEITNTNSFQDYPIVKSFTAPINLKYFAVTAWGGSETNPSTVLIQSITITETAPPPSFTLSPATLSIPCGSTSPVTFTVTNVNNTPGVTGYTWNLGPTPTGWLYNGAVAPSTIPTSTNTLTLTPLYGATPQGVSATVLLGTTQLNTNTAAVTLQQPSLSISGPNSFCTTSDYYGIDNLPANASVHWYDYSGITTPNTPNGTITTLTVNPGQAGVASLYAVVNTGCGNPIDLWLENIHAGSADAVSYTEFSSNGFGQPTLCRHPYDYDDYANTFAAYLEYPAVGAVNLTYRISEYPGNYPVYSHTIYDFQEGQTYPLPADLNAGQYTFEAWTTNSCGTAPFVFSELITYDDCTQMRQAISATVYPNPASGNLNVYVTDATSKTQTISPQMRFTLYDMTNSRVVKAWQMAGGQKQYSLNIAGVRKGNYFLHIMKGNQKVVKQVRVE